MEGILLANMSHNPEIWGLNPSSAKKLCKYPSYWWTRHATSFVLKVYRPIFQNLVCCFIWNGQAVWMYGAILYFAVAYLTVLSLIMVTITRHIFINIFWTEHFLAVKFWMGYQKSMSFLVIAESWKVWKKFEKIGLGSFNLPRCKLWTVMGCHTGKNVVGSPKAGTNHTFGAQRLLQSTAMGFKN